MTGHDDDPKPVYKRGTLVARPGQPIHLTEQVEVSDAVEISPLSRAIHRTLRAYRKAAQELLEGKYANVRDVAPPHLRSPCHIYVLCCPDGILVRYDLAGAEEPKVRCADRLDELPMKGLAEVAPRFSEQVIHVPDDPTTYVLQALGPGFVLSSIIDSSGHLVEHARIHPVILVPKTLLVDFKMPAPSTRPPCLVSLHKEMQVQLHGTVLPMSTPAKAIPRDVEHFVAHGVASLPVGWQAIEVYPLLSEDYWKPEYARTWAELDLLSAIMQRNSIESDLNRLDGRKKAREHHARLIEQFESLLAGPEEPVHRFLKSHPGLICPTHEPGAVWSKLPFGANVSDFVFRESFNDYLLVEIEAPHRSIFRKDGHPRQELHHAISQIGDWVQYIQLNHTKVEQELGLTGISVTPRELVVIGRSASLTGENQQTLTAMQTQRGKLTILTYDQIIDRARANVERHFGPLSLRAQNLDLYFYRETD